MQLFLLQGNAKLEDIDITEAKVSLIAFDRMCFI